MHELAELVMRWGHIPIGLLLLAILHGVKFRFYIYRNGDEKRRVKWGVFFNDKDGKDRQIWPG